MKNVMWGRWELDFVHISRFISQSCTKEKDGCAEVCLDVQAIVLISLEVSTDVSEIRPTPASGKRGGNWVVGRVRLVLRS